MVSQYLLGCRTLIQTKKSLFLKCPLNLDLSVSMSRQKNVWGRILVYKFLWYSYMRHTSRSALVARMKGQIFKDGERAPLDRADHKFRKLATKFVAILRSRAPRMKFFSFLDCYNFYNGNALSVTDIGTIFVKKNYMNCRYLRFKLRVCENVLKIS